MCAVTFGRRYISWAPLHLGAVTFGLWAPLHLGTVTFHGSRYIWKTLHFMGAVPFGRRYLCGVPLPLGAVTLDPRYKCAPLHLGTVTFAGYRYIWAPLHLTLVTNVRRYIWAPL